MDCLCGVASGRLPFPPKSSSEAPMAPGSSWLPSHPHRSLTPPHLQMLTRLCPYAGPDRLRKAASKEAITGLMSSIVTMKTHFYAMESSGRVQVQQNVKDERVSGTSGLGDFFSPNGKMMLFSLNSMYVRHICCIFAARIYYQASPVGQKINTLREGGVQNTCAHTRHAYTSLDKKMDNNQNSI